MRKGQIEILEKLKSIQAPEYYITFCSREDLLLYQLKGILDYCYKKIYISKSTSKIIFQNEDIAAFERAFEFVEKYYDELITSKKLDAVYFYHTADGKVFLPSKHNFDHSILFKCLDAVAALKIFDIGYNPEDTFLLLDFNQEFLKYDDYDFDKVFRMYRKLSILPEATGIWKLLQYTSYIPSLVEAEKWIIQYVEEPLAFQLDAIKATYDHKLSFDEMKTFNFDYKGYIEKKEKDQKQYLHINFPFLKESPYYGEREDQKLYCYNKEMVDCTLDCALKYGAGYNAILDSYAERCIIKYSSNAVYMTFLKYKKVEISTKKFVSDNQEKIKSEISGKKVVWSNKVVLFLDNKTLYAEHTKISKKIPKLYPLPVKTCVFMYHNYFLFKEFIKCFMDSMYKEGYFVSRDIYNYISDPKANWSVVPSISVNDCISMHNLNELMNSKYKTASFINWNKGNLYVNWLLFKSINMVDAKSKNILIECARSLSNSDRLLDFYDRIKKYYNYADEKGLIKYNLLVYCIDYRCPENTYWDGEDAEGNTARISHHDVIGVITDYIDISRKLKRKISLRFKSAKKVKDVHNEVAAIDVAKYTPLIKIPNNSRFKKLRELLPEEFEWITTKKRIVYEGIIMHHCVASYADKVNNDICAIYSFIYKKWNKRYTIEFRMKRNGIYYINQIQSACDRGGADEVWKYVESFIR